MQVHCEKCLKDFEIPVKTAGKIEYSRCENVFRVSYKFRVSCIHCKTILRLSPKGNHAAIGIPDEVDTQEKTIASQEMGEDEVTLPKTGTDGDSQISQLATVRISKSSSSVVKKPTFIFTHESDAEIRRPMHLSLRPKRKLNIPFQKIL